MKNVSSNTGLKYMVYESVMTDKNNYSSINFKPVYDVYLSFILLV